jgi:uncharacterized membrane protein
MNYNPYAAPQAAPLQAQGTAPVGAPQPWEVGEVLSRAWEIYKLHWGVLTGALAVFVLCAFVPFGVLGGILGATGNGPGTDTYTGASGGMQILAQMIQAFFMIGLYRMFLAAARGETPQFATLFSGGPRFLPYFGLTILLLLIYGFGFILLLVPGIILSCGLWASGFFIADTNIGVIDSLKSSWEATKGHKGQYFIFTLVGGLLQIAGLLACCFGLLVTGPIFFLAQAIIFLRITGRGAAMATPAAAGYGGYGGPPPGYGGPPGGPPPGGGGYGGPPPGAPPGGYGPPGGGGGGYGPPGGGGGGYGPPGGGGYGPQGGGGGYGGPPPAGG